MRFSNKTILVTGAGSGIGLATTKMFLAEGATVIATDIHTDRLEAISRGEGERFIWRVSDAGDGSAIAELTRWIEQECGGLDVLVNNAGFARLSNPEEVVEADYDAQMAVLLRGPIFYVKQLAHLLRESSNGSVVNISSASAVLSAHGYCPYALAKTALHKFTEDCVIQVPGIRHNTIMPGFIETTILLETYGEDASAHISDVIAALEPIGRMGKPEDIAAAVLFLASEAATYINGAKLVIDGGVSRLNTAVSIFGGQVALKQ